MRLIRQTWLLPITPYLHHWDTHWLTITSLLTKTSNLGLMTSWSLKTNNFFGVISGKNLKDHTELDPIKHRRIPRPHLEEDDSTRPSAERPVDDHRKGWQTCGMLTVGLRAASPRPETLHRLLAPRPTTEVFNLARSSSDWMDRFYII
ncbi:hypothetical protein TNCV_4522901 [Trichonephila clavipes]|nr:hypothetical protein TNCV_4522901 [Trichonephila clavipes]